tara:strand:+ start:7951 stop:8505 length:555 start_codon:yes stop_codon:yes gene_type:complete
MESKKVDNDIIWAPWMRIMLYGDECLNQACDRVEKFDQNLSELALDMGKTMYSAGGVGLAAPQVNRHERIITVDCSNHQDDIKYLVNPEIVDSHGRVQWEEGCLSFPGLVLPVGRHKQIEVKAQNLQGEEIRFEADGLLSVCIQHEIDHLDGITFIQKVSRQVRRASLRKWDMMEYLREHDGDY